MLKAIKQGKYIVVDRKNEAPSNVSQRFNSLYDKTYNNEKPIFEVSEENKIDIHPNFSAVCACDLEYLKDMSPAFLNRFDYL